MIDQPAAIDRSAIDTSATGTRPQERSAAGRLPAVWRFRLLLGLVCAGAGILSVMLGPDNYWDLRYYHLYAPWAYLHGRYLYDIGPAQEQGFLNPTADFLLYGLISSPLNDWPRLVAFIMGAVHGINAALLLVIVCRVIRPPDAVERATLRAAAWLMGVSGAGFVGLLGTSTNDLTSALFVLGALAGLIAVGEGPSGRASWRGFAAAGLWAGLGLGLKYTVAFVVPGLGVVAVLSGAAQTHADRPHRVRARGRVRIPGVRRASPAHAVECVPQSVLSLSQPDFSIAVFRADADLGSALHTGQLSQAHDLSVLLDQWIGSYVVSEPAFRDWRAAIAYVAIASWTGGAWRWRRVHGAAAGCAMHWERRPACLWCSPS